MSRWVREPDEREELDAMERQYERSLGEPVPLDVSNGVVVGSRLPLIDEDRSER